MANTTLHPLVTIEEACRRANMPIEPDSTGNVENREYARGIVELIADTWPTPGVYMDQRKREVAQLIGIAPGEVA